MITTLKRNKDLFIINSFSLGLGFLFYYLLGHKIEILSATIVTGISLSIGFRQYKIENDKIFKELFEKFNEVYDLKFNNELIRIDIASQKEKDFTLTEIQKLLIVDYLNLCAEEYLWFKMDRIPDEVWSSWENGMVYYLNIKSINAFTKNEKKQSDSYYGLFEKIGKRIQDWQS